jgi:hypothetical protein
MIQSAQRGGGGGGGWRGGGGDLCSACLKYMAGFSISIFF